MKRRFYIAYGSNLHRERMGARCPGSQAIGTAEIKGYRLAFKGRETAACLTIEPCRGSTVPAGIYSVTEEDEAALDRYEGFPWIYHKEEMTLTVTGIGDGKKTRKRAFVYIMDEQRDYGTPTQRYMDICREGYADFGFDEGILQKAYEESREELWKRLFGE